MPSLLFLLPYCAYAPHPTSVTAPALPLWPTHPAVAHQARGTGPWLPLLPYMFTTPSVTAVDRHEVYLRRNESLAAMTTTITRYIHTTAWFSTLLLSTCTSPYPSICFTADICFLTTIHLLPQHERFHIFQLYHGSGGCRTMAASCLLALAGCLLARCLCNSQ